MSEEISKTIVYPNGEVMNINNVRNLLFEYWKLNETEKVCFQRMIKKRPDVPADQVDFIFKATKITSSI